MQIFLMLILSFCLISKVNASSISWESLVKDLGLYLEENYDASVTKTNSSFKAVISDLELLKEELDISGNITLSNYIFELSYKNDVISLASKDKSKLNSNDRVINAYLDTDMLLYLIELINEKCDGSDFDISSSLEENTLSNYGIELVFEDISTEQIDAFDISKFSINLNTFENKIKSLKNNKKENPEVDGSVPEVDGDPVSGDENEANPSTGDSIIYIIFAFLILCVGLIVYKFRSINNYNSL